MVDQFNLGPKDRFKWDLKVMDGGLKIVIAPISGGI
jgi:hypothetical protein